MDQTLDDISAAIDLAIDGAGPLFAGFAGDGEADAATAAGLPDRAAPIPLVPHDPTRATPGSSPSWSLDGHLIQQLLEDWCLVRLPGRQDQGEEFALTLRPEVDFGTETALASAERLLLCPPFPPAAC